MDRVFYRYMAGHVLETLSNCWFMVSRPSKYRKSWSASAPDDGTECMPQIDMVEQFPWLANYKVEPSVFRENFNAVFANPKTMDSMIRILCLSDPARRSDTDLYMWDKYAGSFSGARIGIQLSVDENTEYAAYKEFRGEYVKYENRQNIINTSNIKTREDLTNQCFNIIYKKNTSYIKESEFRLLTDCRHLRQRKGHKGIDFLRLQNGMIVSVDVGYKMPRRDVVALFKLCKRNYNIHNFREAMPHEKSVEYKVLQK